MVTTKKIAWNMLVVVLVSGLGMGCELPYGDDDRIVYSYEMDVFNPGVFNSASHTMTMNAWFLNWITRWGEWYDYDAWIGRDEKNILYKDETLKTRFSGSDMVNEDTVFYCSFPFGGRGAQIGELTGTIDLAGIFTPLPKVWIQGVDRWWFNGKIDMNEVTSTSATLNWSIPVYEQTFTPNSNYQFKLLVLPNGVGVVNEVPVPINKVINNANQNVGSLGEVSIKGVTLSGTINVTYNGEPVPYVRIYANYEVHGTLQFITLSSPEPNAPWSMVLESSSTERDITFQVFGYSDENLLATSILFDEYAKAASDDDINYVLVYVANEGVTGIVLDLGETGPLGY